MTKNIHRKNYIALIIFHAYNNKKTRDGGIPDIAKMENKGNL